MVLPLVAVAVIENAVVVFGVGLVVGELIVTATLGRGPTVTDADA